MQFPEEMHSQSFPILTAAAAATTADDVDDVDACSSTSTFLIYCNPRKLSRAAISHSVSWVAYSLACRMLPVLPETGIESGLILPKNCPKSG